MSISMCDAILKQNYHRAHACQMQRGCAPSSNFFHQVKKKLTFKPSQRTATASQVAMVRQSNCTALQRKEEYAGIILFHYWINSQGRDTVNQWPVMYNHMMITGTVSYRNWVCQHPFLKKMFNLIEINLLSVFFFSFRSTNSQLLFDQISN